MTIKALMIVKNDLPITLFLRFLSYISMTNNRNICNSSNSRFNKLKINKKHFKNIGNIIA